MKKNPRVVRVESAWENGSNRHEVFLKSGNNSAGPTESLALARAIHKDNVHLAQLTKKYHYITSIEVKDTQCKSDLYIDINSKIETKSIAYNHFRGLEGVVFDINEVAKRELGEVKPNRKAIKESGGKYGDIFSNYIERLDKIYRLELTPDKQNVRCTLKDGRVADSIKHPNDDFDIDLGILWAYINATNVEQATKGKSQFEDDLDTLIRGLGKTIDDGGKKIPYSDEFITYTLMEGMERLGKCLFRH